MSAEQIYITLNNGIQIPALGFGVFQIPPEQTADAVEAAIQVGYRLIDTAASYRNERQVGEAVRRSGVDRAELCVQTKLWISDYGYDSALRAFERSLRNLGLEYVDLYLLHWPMPSDFRATLASYRAAEKLLADGLVRAIGVCNFNPGHLERLIANANVVPAVNQVELHPYFVQRAVCEADAAHGIITQAWSPLGGVYVYMANARSPLEDPTIVQLAGKYGKTPAQVILRWHLQRGRSVIPKSVRAERIRENFEVWDFELASEELDAIDTLDMGVRGGPDPELVDTKMFPRRIED